MIIYFGFKVVVYVDNEWIFSEVEDVFFREDLFCLIA